MRQFRIVNPDIPDSVFESIVQCIASGTPVKAALDDHMCSRYDYDKARRKDPLKSTAHARARQDGADAMADDVVHIADTVLDPQRAKNMMESRKWLAGVIKPREYGPRMELALTDTSDPAELHRLGRERARLMRDPPIELIPQVIDGAVIHAPNATDSQSAAPSIFD